MPRTVPYERSLMALYPKIAEQWHPELNGDMTPTDVTKSSAIQVYWQCDLGHEWKSSVNNRTNTHKLTGCPYCSGARSIQGTNDFATTHSTLAKQWHPTKNNGLVPEKVTAGSGKKVWFVCSKGHERFVAVRRIILSPDCQRCLLEDDSIDVTHPIIAAEWHPTKNEDKLPGDVTAGSAFHATWLCSQGHEWNAYIYARTRGSGCPECAACTYVSQPETELCSLIDIFRLEYFTSVRSVIKGELDIYIPSKNIAIEFNGLYWHSEESGKDRNYHANKSKACAKKGIQLIHVWEDDWRDRRDIVVRALAHRLNVTERLNEPGVLLAPDSSLTQRYGARTLPTEVITHAESSAFLEANHIQGASTGTLHTGLRDKTGILRAVFVAKRVGNKNHEGEWRIERYATRGIVPGGFTKLMKFTEVQISERGIGILKTWVTFSDGALSDGGLYRNYGFVEDGFVNPDYQYVVSGKRVHKFNYRLKRFRDDPTLQYDGELSERGLAQLNKIPRIWDSGKTRWVKTI